LPRSVPKQRRAQWWCLYGPPIRVSTVNVNKSSHRIIFLRRAKSPLCSVVFWRRRAALEPQSCDDLLIDKHRESPATSGDNRLFIPSGDGDPIARSCGLRPLSRAPDPASWFDSGRLKSAFGSEPHAARHHPEPFLVHGVADRQTPDPRTSISALNLGDAG